MNEEVILRIKHIRMNRIILLLIFQLTLSYLASGQTDRVTNQNTISVVVSDTISVTPDEIIYRFLIGNEENPSRIENQSQYVSESKFDSIVASHSDVFVISTKSLNYGSADYQLIEVLTRIKIDDISIFVNLLDDLSGYQNLGGFILEKIVDNESEVEMELKKRLINQAKNRLSNTCKIIGAKLNGIYSIDEQEFQDNYTPVDVAISGWTAYPPQGNTLGQLCDKIDAIYFLKMEVRYNFKYKLFR